MSLYHKALAVIICHVLYWHYRCQFLAVHYKHENAPPTDCTVRCIHCYCSNSVCMGLLLRPLHSVACIQFARCFWLSLSASDAASCTFVISRSDFNSTMSANVYCDEELKLVVYVYSNLTNVLNMYFMENKMDSDEDAHVIIPLTCFLQASDQLPRSLVCIFFPNPTSYF